MILTNYSKYLLQFCEKQINMIYRIYLPYEGFHIFKKHLPKKKKKDKKILVPIALDQVLGRLELIPHLQSYLRVMVMDQIEIDSQFSHAFKCFFKHKSEKKKKSVKQQGMNTKVIL